MAKILVLDDTVAILKSMKMLLEALDHDVVTCETIEEADAAIANERPDLVISDYQLARGNSFPFIRRLEPLLPVLLHTASEIELPEDLKIRLSAVIIKPVGADDLQRCISAALAH